MSDTSSLGAIDLALSNMHCDRCMQRVEQQLQGMPGVESVEVRMGGARIIYYPQLTGPRIFSDALNLLGYPVVRPAESKKGPIGRWIDRLGKSNRRNFGDASLDCCTLNRKNREKG